MRTAKTLTVRPASLLRLLVSLALLGGTHAIGAERRISEDRELKEFDLSNWDCRERLQGTAKTPDAIERNRLKNRSAIEPIGLPTMPMETASFLQHVTAFEAQTKNTRRKDLNPTARAELDPLEKEIVSFDGYLVLAYAGPPESTNCGSSDFHDWHLEVFAEPLDHAPQIGDPTPIICEITPRTQSAIFRHNIRVQTLAGFIRAPDLTLEPTGHPARKIRVTGYLLWDDEHNGRADVGTTIRAVGANKYHQPWRATAWEIHPVIKIEALETASTLPADSPSPIPIETSLTSTLTPSPALSLPRSPQFATIVQPIRIKIPDGETVLLRGTKLAVVSHDAKTVTVCYLNANPIVPIASTDFQ